MRTLFVSPHPDDAALSCGGLLVRLREAGDDIGVVTLYSGSGGLDRLSDYQRLALGFGEPDMLDRPAPTPFEIAELRREEDRTYAALVGAKLIHLDLPDAVFRDYVGDEELFGDPKAGDPAPVAELEAVIGELGPDRVYLPLAVGTHVDHRLARRAAMRLMDAGRIDRTQVRFYEDFPYAHNVGFEEPAALDAEFVAIALPLEPELVDIVDTLERKVAGLEAYPSQLGRLFGGDDPMSRAIRARAALLGERAGIGAAERYWRLAR